MRHTRAVMHAGIANSLFPLTSTAGENLPGIPGACATRNFTYLVRGPCHWNNLDDSQEYFPNTVCKILITRFQRCVLSVIRHIFMKEILEHSGSSLSVIRLMAGVYGFIVSRIITLPLL